MKLAVNRPTTINMVLALLGGLVFSSLLLNISLIYGWFPQAESIDQFQTMLFGVLLVGGFVIAVPIYFAFDRWGLIYG